MHQDNSSMIPSFSLLEIPYSGLDIMEKMYSYTCSTFVVYSRKKIQIGWVQTQCLQKDALLINIVANMCS